VLACGGEPLRLPIARDRLREISARVDRGLARGADLFLTSGGISAGKYDLVKEVLALRGRVDFWQVLMQPGRPVALGEVDAPSASTGMARADAAPDDRSAGDSRIVKGVPLIGLPGNPVSSMVAFVLFARPAILKMLGQRALRKPEVSAVLLEDAHGYPDRRRYVRAVVEEEAGRYTAHLTGPQGAGMLTSLVRANGLAIIPEGTYPAARAGTTVRVMMVDWPEIE
jgi:molybdopterin molybdotransferase